MSHLLSSAGQDIDQSGRDLIRNEMVLHGRPPDHEAIVEIVDQVVLPAIRHAAPPEEARQPDTHQT